MKKIAILGFGKSGKAAYDVLKSQDCDLFVFDDKSEDASHDNFFFGKDASIFNDFEFDEVVVSPGIPKNHPFIKRSIENGISVISEMEFGYRLAKCPIIAITGTNGKTTTVAMIDKIMKANNKKTIACGNYGYPITKAALESSDLDYLIVEVSSYQLEFIKEFKPYIAAILNIGFDHIKYHGSREEYRDAKLKIFKNQSQEDYFIKNKEDAYEYNGRAEIVRFSRIDKDADCFLDKNKVVVNYGCKDIIDLKKIKLFGYGNAENIAVCVLVSELCGLNSKKTMEVIRGMENLSNRLEFVGELDGVKFYNDSKSTNIDSVVNALNSFDGNNIVLILGGKHKGESFSKIVDLLKEKTRAVVVYGEDKHVIITELEKLLPIPLPAIDIRGAVVGAFEVAAKGDIVLFSPGGSSCEPFKNYEERGEAFKKEFSVYKDYYENTPGV
jgi:UDP-N-acetylmuramoylalanine--D-glutamate ligase